MKIFKILSLALLLLVAMTGCKKNSSKSESDAAKLAGEWHLVSWNEAEPQGDVYIAFTANGTFDIYQQVWSLNYVHFDGTFNISGDILTGNYTDGSIWASGYKFQFAGEQLMLYSQEDVSIASVYEKCQIPEEIKAEATATRGEEIIPFL